MINLYGEYIKILKILIINNFKREICYKTNLLINGLVIILGNIINLIYYITIYKYTDHISDWNKVSIFILIGSISIIESVFGGIFFLNIIRIPQYVRTYEMDYFLLKPRNTFFLLLTKYGNIGLFGGGLFGLILIIYVIMNYNITITFLNIFLYIIDITLAISIVTLCFLILTAFSLRFVRIDGLISIFWTTLEFGKYPKNVFNILIQIVFTFIVPTIVIYNLPVYILIGKNIFIILFLTILILIVLYRILNYVWNQNLKRYYW